MGQTIKDKISLIIIGVLLLLFIAACAVAAVQRGKAIKAAGELLRISQEERIDEPYMEKLAQAGRRIEELEKSLEISIAEAATTKAGLAERDKVIKAFDVEYEKLVHGRPVLEKIKEKYSDEDIDGICTAFAALGYPCELIRI